MDLVSDLLPAVPSLLDPTNPLHNMTLLTNTFIGAFLGTFIANLAAQTVRNILGESDKNSAQNQTQNIILQSRISPAIQAVQDRQDTDWRMIPAVG